MIYNSYYFIIIYNSAAKEAMLKTMVHDFPKFYQLVMLSNMVGIIS